MTMVEINFDGIIGPSHNYAGLSLGNLASAKNAGGASSPRAAALQGVAKMRANLDLGLTQGFFMPQDRPNQEWLQWLATDWDHADDALRAVAFSASSMWAANAATVSPAPDTTNGKCHLLIANLVTMPHRSHEWRGTLHQLQTAFAHDDFWVHTPAPAPFGDEGAANHMRLCANHAASGVEIFVYGVTGGPYPARQHIQASKMVARRNQVVDPIFVQQSDEAIAAGAFHNDVVAVANENILFTHEHAFADKEQFYAALRVRLPQVEIIEVPADQVSLSDAIQSYLFNAQLVTLPDNAGMALILPTEAQENARVWTWLTTMIAGNGPIRRLIPVDVRQSMANGGGPACLRLRVVCDPNTVDQRFIADHDKLNMIAEIITEYWPESIAPDQLSDPALISQVQTARSQLLTACSLTELE
jgi:succinylarginine dihydrolase